MKWINFWRVLLQAFPEFTLTLYMFYFRMTLTVGIVELEVLQDSLSLKRKSAVRSKLTMKVWASHLEL